MPGYIADCPRGHRGMFVTVSVGEDICGVCGMSMQMYKDKFHEMLRANEDLEIELEGKEVLIQKLEEEVSNASQ